MNRTFSFLVCAGALIFAGCTSDSKLPNPSGKGTVRAIHAMPGTTDVIFKIEERTLGNLNYKQSSTPARYDDFSYNFNFDIFVPEETGLRRIASVPQKIDANREYVFALTGTVDNPTVTTWATDLRQWDGTETVFEARFAHLSVTLGDVDVYFDDPANPPSSTNLVATLSPGDIMDIADFAAGIYVITVTAAGDPNRVPVYTSSEVTFNAQTSHVVSIFDGNENDTAPYVLGTMTTSGVFLRMPDATVPPSVRFVHGALTLQNVDVYSDELLTSQVTGDVAFGTATTDLTGSLNTTYYFTPAGSVATTLFSTSTSNQLAGGTGDFYLIGDTDEWRGLFLTQNRASISTAAKISIVNTSINNSLFDMYLKDRDDPLVEDDTPVFRNVLFSLATSPLQVLAGSYDVYLTETGTKTEFAGPFPIDVVLGDVVFLMAADDVDPAKIDLRDVSVP